jgi:hypothetical protein
VLCENLPTGALSNPAPVHPTTLDSPFPTNGETSSAELPVTQTFSPLVCRECGNAKTARQKFCPRCTTRIRVAKHRRTPVNKIKAEIQGVYDDHLRRRRTAICDQATLTERNQSESAGLDTGELKRLTPELERERRIERLCKDANKRLRAEFKTKRDEVKRAKKENWAKALRKTREFDKQLKGLTPALKKEIAASEATIRSRQTPKD